ncbi:MAG TPA: YciI family protein [Micavibrio sp.]|nr:YciI family protein [Micavibrio sp.]
MPQFIVIGHDGKDQGATERRKAARDAHLKVCAESVSSGNQLIGAATLDEAGGMNGSVMVMDFPDRAALDEWLKREPYVSGKVWERVDVIPCKVPDTFAHCFPKK